MDNLFEQMANITKAHGYDILSKQVGELKSERDALEAQVKELKDALTPFADMFGELSESKVQQGGSVYQYNKAHITVADLLRASSLLKK